MVILGDLYVDRLQPTARLESAEKFAASYDHDDHVRWTKWAEAADLPPPLEPLQQFEVFRETTLQEVCPVCF